MFIQTKRKINRRFFLYLTLSGLVLSIWPILKIIKKRYPKALFDTDTIEQVSHIYISRNGTPQQNVAKVIEMMGGIRRIIGVNDIVILKPNIQWWNQGRTNLAAIKGFIDLVLDIPKFEGEIIIAENHHFIDESLPENKKDNIRGWTHLSEINGDIDGVNHNIDTLIESYHNMGYKNITKYHWRDGGQKPNGIWGNAGGGKIVEGPEDGDGYVWSDLDYEYSAWFGLKKWKVKMTYPIFTSSYSGITIDFKNGAYLRDGKKGGSYLSNKPIKFINFAALNTHGSDTGITSSLKNYMGIMDLTCGAPGVTPQGYYNVHHCGGRFFGFAKAGPIGYFIKTIRKADLNIVTAEWVGWGDRTNVKKAKRLRTILASTDPIALDYYSAKHLIYPLSGKAEYHDPDKPDSSIHRFLKLALEVINEGTIDESRIRIHRHDFHR